MTLPQVQGLPPLPWTVAPEDPPDTEIVAEFPGEWEPKRECVFYGSSEPPGIQQRIVRPSSVLRLRQFHNVIVAPNHIILSYTDGRLLPATYALGHSTAWVKPGPKDPFAPQIYNPWLCRADPVRVDEPVFLAEPAWNEYGHVLLEVAPKLAMLTAVSQETRVITSGWSFPPMLAALGADDTRLASFHGPLFCRTLYVPDPPIDTSGNFHLLARRAYAKIVEVVGRATAAATPRLFLSRSHIAARHLRNEVEIEALFAGYGFEIVCPERLPVGQQIELISSAEMIAGCGGSAMHSLVFAAPQARVLILSSDRWFSNIDQYIAKADGQYGYVIGTGEVMEGTVQREWPWTVDVSTVEQAIHEHFGL